MGSLWRRFVRWYRARRVLRGGGRIKTGIPEVDAIMEDGIPAEKLGKFYGRSEKVNLKYDPLEGFHYDDCEGESDPTCWCEHRGPSSHYGGGIKPGWHREDCPMVGVAWIVTWDMEGDNTWWTQPKCECQMFGTGQYVLTLQSGEVHGPSPGPKPDPKNVVTISGEEINEILKDVKKKDEDS